MLLTQVGFTISQFYGTEFLHHPNPYRPKLCFLSEPSETHRMPSASLSYHTIENKTGGFNLLQILGVRPLNRGCHKGCAGLRRQLALLPRLPRHQLCVCFIYWASTQVFV